MSTFIYISISICQSVPKYISINVCRRLSTFVYLSDCLSVSICLNIYICLLVYLLIYLSTYTHTSIYLYLSIIASFNRPIYLPVFPSTHPFVNMYCLFILLYYTDAANELSLSLSHLPTWYGVVQEDPEEAAHKHGSLQQHGQHLV